MIADIGFQGHAHSHVSSSHLSHPRLRISNQLHKLSAFSTMAPSEQDVEGQPESSFEVFVHNATEIRVTARPNACFNRGPVKVGMNCPGWRIYKTSVNLAPLPYSTRARASQSPSASETSGSAQACSSLSARPVRRGGTTEALKTAARGSTRLSEGPAWCRADRGAREDIEAPSTVADCFCSKVPQKRKRPEFEDGNHCTSECRSIHESVRISRRQISPRLDNRNLTRKSPRICSAAPRCFIVRGNAVSIFFCGVSALLSKGLCV